MTQLACYLDRSAELGDDPLADDQPEPGPRDIFGRVGFDAIEFLEETGQAFLRDSDTRVAHRQLDPILAVGRGDRDGAPGPAVFDGVAHEVAHQHAEADRVAAHRRQARRNRNLKGQRRGRGQLSLVLEGIVCQALLPRASGKGRIVALEILVPTPAIRNLIREDKIHQIYSSMQAGQEKVGMQTFNQSLATLYLTRQITMETAVSASSLKDELVDMINRGVGVVAGAGLGPRPGMPRPPVPGNQVRR